MNEALKSTLEFHPEEILKPGMFKGFGEVIDQSVNIIKVVGVGGGGSNAVKNMVEAGLKNITFAVVNTDSQALKTASVPNKLQIGKTGLGVGGDPVKGREAAEESIEEIKHLFDDNTKMVFITAGMGGGTGTGASPIIADIAREKGILTVGVVTLPFGFEKKHRINQALKGVMEFKKSVDSLLVINNQRLMEIYDDKTTTIEDAMKMSDEVVTTATRSIAEIITEEGKINRDFCDVQTVLQNGGSAIMSSGKASGDNRIVKAMTQALDSPMLNRAEIEKSKRLLYIVYQSHKKQVLISELNEINAFMEQMPADLEVLWGLYFDDSLEDQVRVDIVATGFDKVREKKEMEEVQNEVNELFSNYYDPIKKKKNGKDIITTMQKKVGINVVDLNDEANSEEDDDVCNSAEKDVDTQTECNTENNESNVVIEFNTEEESETEVSTAEKSNEVDNTEYVNKDEQKDVSFVFEPETINTITTETSSIVEEEPVQTVYNPKNNSNGISNVFDKLKKRLESFIDENE